MNFLERQWIEKKCFDSLDLLMWVLMKHSVVMLFLTWSLTLTMQTYKKGAIGGSQVWFQIRFTFDMGHRSCKWSLKN